MLILRRGSRTGVDPSVFGSTSFPRTWASSRSILVTQSLIVAACLLQLALAAKVDATVLSRNEYLWTSPPDGGVVRLTVEILDNFRGDFGRYEWQYTIENISYDPPFSPPIPSNGVSLFSINFPAPVPEFADQYGPPGWRQGFFFCSPTVRCAEWFIMPSDGTGVLVGGRGVFGFSTVGRPVVVEPRDPAASIFIRSYMATCNGGACFYLFSGTIDRPLGDSLPAGGISPDRATNDRSLVVELSGQLFTSDTSVALVRPGLRISGGSSLVSPDGRTMEVEFNLTDCAPGLWDVVITNADQSSTTLRQAFTVMNSPKADGVSPRTGGDIGSVTLTVFGKRFRSGQSLVIRSATSEIPAKNIHVSNDGRAITGTVELKAQPRERFDVVIGDPDGFFTSLAQAFTVEEGRSAGVWVAVYGRGAIRVGQPEWFYLKFGNPGNVDRLGPLIAVRGIPQGSAIRTDFGSLLRDPGDALATLQKPESVLEFDADLGVEVTIGLLPAGTVGGLILEITPPNVDGFTLRTTVVDR